MLDQAMQTLGENEKPVVHTDRGAHYRWQGWIDRMDSNDLIRSMSNKVALLITLHVKAS